MDLADRSGGKGPLLERREDFLRRSAQLSRHDRSNLVVGERPDLAEQLEQLGAVRRREQVEAHRQHLTELDPRAAELLDGKAHAHGARFRRRPERELGQDEVAREDDQDAPQPAGVAEEGPHRAHLPAAAMSMSGGAVGELARHRIALRRQGSVPATSVGVIVHLDAASHARPSELFLPIPTSVHQHVEGVARPLHEEAQRTFGRELALARHAGPWSVHARRTRRRSPRAPPGVARVRGSRTRRVPPGWGPEPMFAAGDAHPRPMPRSRHPWARVSHRPATAARR